MNAKVIVGMSGGVDSSVAALLLKQQGFVVEGLFMKNWEEDDDEQFCAANYDLKDAKLVCDTLGIKLHKVNFAAEYWDRVFAIFLSEYKNGRTPNPDILCNKEIKFTAFLNYAKKLKADFIATGHYASIQQNGNNYLLKQAFDRNKDQSYFLYALNQQQLSHCLFPLGDLTKSKVRAIAKTAGFNNHDKKDSTGICFIGERKFKQFLGNYLPHQPGDITTIDGDIIGKHDGLMYHTIGQRKGLNIGGQKTHGSKHTPWYVVAKDLTKNQLIVAPGNNHPKLFKQTLLALKPSWIANTPTANHTYEAKIRYRQQQQPCQIEYTDNVLQVTFNEPQRAITPGQSIVFYQNDICLGGAIIAA